MAASTQVEKGGRKRAVTRGTANVFADLGFPDAIERQAKLRLAYTLNQILAPRQRSPVNATASLCCARSEGEALRRYRLANISLGRLMTLLTALDRDVEIVVRGKPRSRRAGRIAIVAA